LAYGMSLEAFTTRWSN